MTEAKHDLNQVLETASVPALEQAARAAVWQFTVRRPDLPIADAVWPFTAYLAAACMSELTRRRELQEDEEIPPRPRALPMPGSIPVTAEGRALLLAAARDVVDIVTDGAESPWSRTTTSTVTPHRGGALVQDLGPKPPESAVDAVEQLDTLDGVARIFEAALEVFAIVLAEAELEASTVQ